ncbi:nuclear transport factor 2 family protein [Actinopolymorpha singaporensis]|uniref:SnoaL-like domain-containing protein n=1 Tax=Actinopolymorpha singaporensis TaxID=117157 RepID=A0A1H1WK09_9ACTN|nr:nuclear transport factor 2 family protein [Actinopolymorpha singaporensis]SDS97435.1 SnoaL-like domain-containing protein [Actinopolymorpha singaporensis]
MRHEDARAFADRWVRAWNAHDLDTLLEHFADDVVFTSPVAARLLGGDGVIRGKEALRAYWTEGLARIPDLRFEVLGVYVGVGTLVINYRNQVGGVVNEVLTFGGDTGDGGGLVTHGDGTYLDDGDNQAGLRVD